MVINELKNYTFSARINLIVDGDRMEVDSRSSNALALAVRAESPILVAESVLNQAGIFLDPESLPGDEAAEAADKGRQFNKPMSKEYLEHMSAYAGFINTLNLDDLDKSES